MKEKIHPKYVETTVICACGSSFVTRSTKPEIRLEICSSCHPFFTGKQKLIDTAGRVERFQKKFSKTEGKTVKAKPKKKKTASPRKAKGKVLTTTPKKRAKSIGAKDAKTVKKEK